MIKVKIDGKIVHLPTLKGADGKSAYQYAVEAGFTGTEQEFINLLIDGTDSINSHLTDSNAHSDIRKLVQDLTVRFDLLANSDDDTLDQLSEIVAYIKDNKSLIESVTNGKINVDDIVDNLTTASADKVLAANQGVELKKLIDALPTFDDVNTAILNHNNSEECHTDIRQTINELEEGMIYTNDMPTVNALGGIAAGTTFNNMPINTLLTKLLYPYIAPTVSATSTPNGGTYEKGVPVAVSKITVTVTKKSEEITKVEVLDGSTSLGVKEDGSVGSLSFPVSLSVTTNKKFTAKVTDASGNTVSATTGQFTFVDPYYYGAASESDTIDETFVKGLTKLVESKASKTIKYTTNNQMMVFAYPKSYGALTKIVDPNQFDVTATWTRNEVSITTASGTAVVYYVYTSKVVTVDNYSMKLNY